MGSWGYNPLENDDAQDLLGDFNKSKNIVILEKALDAVCYLSNDEYLQAPAAEQAIAAAHIIKDLSNPQINLETRARLNEKAERALRRVLEQSELKDLWAESPLYDEWTKAVRALLSE